MMQLVFKALPLLVLALILTDQSACSQAADGPRSLSKILTNDLMPIVGVIQESEQGTIAIFDIGARKMRSFDEEEIRSAKHDISDQEAIHTVGLPTLFAWRIQNLIPSDRVSGQIALVDFPTVFLTVGADKAVKKGDEVTVYRDSGELKDPTTGEVLGRRRRKIAMLEVTEIEERFTKAKLVGDFEVKLEVGDVVESTNGTAIAIFPLTNERGNATKGGIGIAEKLTTRLTEFDIPVVERKKLATVLTELAISQSTIFDQQSTQKIGQQVGAYAVVTGTMLSSKRRTEANLRLIEVATGKVLFALSSSIPRIDDSLGNFRTMLPATTNGKTTHRVGTKFDVLSILQNPAEHANLGTWRMEGNKLSNDHANSRIAIPIPLSGSYRLAAQFRRRSGADAAIIVLPVGNRNVSFEISGYKGVYHGLSYINGRHASDNREATFRPGAINNGDLYQLEINVIVADDSATIQVNLNGTSILKWNGSLSSLSAPPVWTPSDRRRVGIGVVESSYEFSQIVLETP